MLVLRGPPRSSLLPNASLPPIFFTEEACWLEEPDA